MPPPPLLPGVEEYGAANASASGTCTMPLQDTAASGNSMTTLTASARTSSRAATLAMVDADSFTGGARLGSMVLMDDAASWLLDTGAVTEYSTISAPMGAERARLDSARMPVLAASALVVSCCSARRDRNDLALPAQPTAVKTNTFKDVPATADTSRMMSAGVVERWKSGTSPTELPGLHPARYNRWDTVLGRGCLFCPDCVCVGDCVRDAVMDAVDVSVDEGVMVLVSEDEDVADDAADTEDVGVSVGVMVEVPDEDAVLEAVEEDELVPEAVCVPVGVLLGVDDCDGVLDGVCEADGVLDGELVGDGVLDGVLVVDADSEEVAEELEKEDDVEVGVSVLDAVADAVLDGDAVSDAVAVEEDVAVSDAVEEDDGVVDAVCVLVGVCETGTSYALITRSISNEGATPPTYMNSGVTATGKTNVPERRRTGGVYGRVMLAFSAWPNGRTPAAIAAAAAPDAREMVCVLYTGPVLPSKLSTMLGPTNTGSVHAPTTGVTPSVLTTTCARRSANTMTTSSEAPAHENTVVEL